MEHSLVELAVRRRPDLLQQHGFLHAKVQASLMDSACGYAAASLKDRDSGVLTVEFTVNLLAPAAAETFVVRGRGPENG